MSDRKDPVSESTGMARKELFQREAALAVAGPALKALLGGSPGRVQEHQECLIMPPEAMRV
jgi:hypothetical protein